MWENRPSFLKKILFYLFLQGKEEIEGKKCQCVVASCTPQTGAEAILAGAENRHSYPLLLRELPINWEIPLGLRTSAQGKPREQLKLSGI